MGLDTELEFDKYCKVVRNPKVGRSSKSEVRGEKRRPPRGSYHLRNIHHDFTEISFARSRSSSCKSTLYLPAGTEALKRDSIYQDSNQVWKNKMGSIEGRQKIEMSPGTDTSLSFRIFDHPSLLDKTCPLVDRRISSLLSLSEENNPSSEVNKSYPELHHPDFQELSFRFPSTQASDIAMSSESSFSVSTDLRDRKDCNFRTIQRDFRDQPKSNCIQATSPLNDASVLLERDAFLTKSLSEKVRVRHSPRRTERNHSLDSPRMRFSQIRRMFDPIIKSKSLRSSPVSKIERDSATVGWENIRRSGAFRKSLSDDFSNSSQKTDSDAISVEKDSPNKVTASSPAHIQGLLTFELKHGVPYFEFSFKDPEDVLSAKTWRANNAFSWVYTFHSKTSNRTSHSNGWGTKERPKESLMIGQMQVSCFLLSEMRNSGGFDNSMVTEFVLYDILHARRTLDAEEEAHVSTKSVDTTKSVCGENSAVDGLPCEPIDRCNLPNHKNQAGYSRVSDDFDSSTHYPWTPSDLHPNLEIAAVVIQVPFETSESLKFKRRDKPGGKERQNLFDFPNASPNGDSIPSSISRANVKVVTPSGAHGLPSKKAGGIPSPLLERWRSGGCCDCGGWDMSCPLLVLDNRIDQKTKDPQMESRQPLELFFQGTRDEIPALTIKSKAEGQFSVDFHARLSKLQAFSICVALLHGCEASTTVEQEKNTQNFHCNSLKVLLNEEARFLLEAVADKDKRSLIARA